MNICIIPARGGSEGIKNKNLIDFCGKPLISWSISQAKRSNHIDQVYVTTDDEEIKKISKEYGAKIVSRPKEISGPLDSSESALIHALKDINVKTNLVAFLQATSPLRFDDDIDKAILQFEKNNSDSLFSSSVFDDLTLWKKGSSWESFNFDYKNRKRRQDTEKFYIENGSIYLFKEELLFREKNRLGGKIDSYLMKSWQYHEIDTMSDLDVTEFYMKKNIL